MQASELSGLTLPANKDQIISHLCLTLISHINQIYKYYDKKTGSRRILHKFRKGVDLFERRLICTENKFCIPLKKV